MAWTSRGCEVADRKGDIGASVVRAVDKGGLLRLIAPFELFVDMFGATECVGDVHDEGLVARRLHRLVGGDPKPAVQCVATSFLM